MTLKFEIEKLDEVEESVRSLYIEKEGGGGFQLGVDGIENIGALKRAKDHEATEHGKTKAQLKKLQDEKKEAEEKARKAAEDSARAAGNTEALEKSWKDKLDKSNSDWQAKYDTDVTSLSADVTRLLIDNVAQSIATEIAIEGSAGILIPHIASRLGVEVREGKRVTVVRDAEGKPSALTIEDLKKEFVGNKAFAPVLAASRGSGSGAGGNQNRGGAAGAKTIKRSEFDKLSNAEKQAKMKERVTVID